MDGVAHVSLRARDQDFERRWAYETFASFESARLPRENSNSDRSTWTPLIYLNFTTDST